MKLFIALANLRDLIKQVVSFAKNKILKKYNMYAASNTINSIKERSMFNELVKTIVDNNMVNARKILDDYKLNLNIKDYRNGITPLHIAAYYNRAELTMLLLSKKANINQTNFAGNTALHIALYGGSNNQRVINTLLAANADPTIRNNKGFSPLDFLNRPRSKPIPFRNVPNF